MMYVMYLMIANRESCEYCELDGFIFIFDVMCRCSIVNGIRVDSTMERTEYWEIYMCILEDI